METQINTEYWSISQVSSYYTAPQRDNERKKDAFTGSIPVLTTKIINYEKNTLEIVRDD